MIYNAFYTLIFLAFLRKLRRKLVDDSLIPVTMYDGDGEGCWVVRIGESCVAYSYDVAKSKALARELMREFPGHPVALIEDEAIEIDAFNLGLSGLNLRERGRLIDIVNAWHAENE